MLHSTHFFLADKSTKESKKSNILISEILEVFGYIFLFIIGLKVVCKGSNMEMIATIT